MKETATMTHPHPPSGIFDDCVADSIMLVALISLDTTCVPFSDSFIFACFIVGPHRNNVDDVYKYTTGVCWCKNKLVKAPIKKFNPLPYPSDLLLNTLFPDKGTLLRGFTLKLLMKLFQQQCSLLLGLYCQQHRQ